MVEFGAEIQVDLSMKNITTALQTFLASKVPMNKTDLFSITLANGQIIYATSGQAPVEFLSNWYYPSKYGAWERGKVPCKVAFTPESVQMELTVKADSTILYPGTSTPLMKTVTAGLFDKALVKVYTLFWALTESVYAGIARGYLTTFVGEITDLEQTGRSQVKFNVTSMDFILNLNMPRNLIQSSCRWTLFDYGCSLLRSNFAKSESAASGSTATVLVLSDTSNPTWWNANMTFAQGSLLFTGGQNNGLWASIKSQNTATGTFPSQITLAAAMPFPVASGDAFTIYPGCNKSIGACTNQFNNLINYGGASFVPNPETAM